MTPQEVAVAVLEQIRNEPDSHDQVDWELSNRSGLACGTTRCVAGWAVHIYGTKVKNFHPSQDVMDMARALFDQEHIMHPADTEEGRMHGDSTSSDHFMVRTGRKLLGISSDAAYALFFRLNNSQALEVMEELAAGRPYPAKYTESALNAEYDGLLSLRLPES